MSLHAYDIGSFKDHGYDKIQDIRIHGNTGSEDMSKYDEDRGFAKGLRDTGISLVIRGPVPIDFLKGILVLLKGSY